MRAIRLFLLLALLVPTAAHAEWREASSANFVVYADDSEKNVRRFSEQLELYHSAMEVLTGNELPVPSPSSRLTVFVVKNEREVRRLLGDGSRYVAGYYSPRAAGSIAVVPRVQAAGRGQPDMAMIVLLHEYAHHFMISSSTMAMPRWLSEGGAEFFASAEFPSAGGISLGMPARHRVGELLYAREVKAKDLLDPRAYSDGGRKGFDSFYGRSWLLYHYLTFDEGRRGQMQAYLRLLASGKGGLEAATEAFGDFSRLDRELDRYLQKRMYAFTFKPGQLDTGTISVRELDAAETAVMPLVIRSRNGVNSEQAAELVAEVRQVAEMFPDSPAVLAALAEAEFDAGENGRAIEAADKALALDGKRLNAYVQKGYALFRQANEADDLTAAYNSAMAPFTALNRIENDHPLPLIYYYRSFADRGEHPADLAVQGLERAVQLAPFDRGLRYDLAVYHLNADNFVEARYYLLPIAYDPHGGRASDGARRVVERIDAGIEGAGAGRELLTLLSSAQDRDDDEDVEDLPAEPE